MTTTTAQMNDLTMEIDIDAKRAVVWQSLTENIGDWWPAEFYAGGEADGRRFLLEPKPGGRMYESWDNGGGLLWATVYCVEPGQRLQVSGLSFPNWGGPSQWLGHWELSDQGAGTRLRFTEHTIGRVSDALTADKRKGWQFLWEVLEAHCTGKPAPAWSD